MNPRFEPGEIVIATSRKHGNRQATIIKMLAPKSTVTRRYFNYVIHVQDYPSKRSDGYWVAPEWCLKRKPQPPEGRADLDNKVPWDTCLWKPLGVMK